MRRALPPSSLALLATLLAGCSSFLGDGDDTAADGAAESAAEAPDPDTGPPPGPGPECQAPPACGTAGSLDYAGGWAQLNGQTLRLYFSTRATACGYPFAGNCDPDCGNYAAYSMTVTVAPELVGVYNLVEQMAIAGESEYGCDGGEAWGESGENEVGGGSLEITEATDTCISGTFIGVAGDASFSVPRC